LQLAQEAARTKADVIVFCGVHFMAETAKILNPDKRVLVPDLGRLLARRRVPARGLREVPRALSRPLRRELRELLGGVKALSDVIVTSQQREEDRGREIPKDRPILFAPDQHLGRYVMKRDGPRHGAVARAAAWCTSCSARSASSSSRSQHPEAKVIAHPECEAAGARGTPTTSGRRRAAPRHVVASPKREFIVATEPGIIHQMERRTPNGQDVHPGSAQQRVRLQRVPVHALNTLEKLYLAMKLGTPELHVDPELARRARAPIDRMLEWS
jgi:quinolinate synthase